MFQFFAASTTGRVFCLLFCLYCFAFGAVIKKNQKSFKSSSAGFQLEFTKPMRQSESRLYTTQHIHVYLASLAKSTPAAKTQTLSRLQLLNSDLAISTQKLTAAVKYFDAIKT